MDKLSKTIITLAIMVVLSGCGEKAPERDCDVTALLLEKSYLNIDTSTLSDEYFESPVSEAPPESAGYSFYLNRGISSDLIQHGVFRYRYVNQAIAVFDARNRNMFRTDDNEGPWELSEELLPIELHAQQSHLACGRFYSERRCSFIARYIEYYVFFEVAISEQGLSVEEFGKGVKKIEELMLACVGV